MNWDYQLFKYINDNADEESFLGQLFILAADKGDVFFAVSLIIIGVLFRKMALYCFFAAGISVLFSRFISLFYFRDRPFVSEDVNLLLPHIESNSFPSDHAVAAFAIAVMLYIFSRRIGGFYICCAVIVSVARIWVGKHYPTDIIAGMAIGIATSLLLFSVLEKYKWYDKLINKYEFLQGNYEKGLHLNIHPNKKSHPFRDGFNKPNI